jgi:hypothetical protein
MIKRAGATSKAPDDPFPAPEKTPGQRESRLAFADLLKRKTKPKWWEDYLALRAEGITWRKAVYIAWRISPVKGRWPKTVEELAVDVLGMHSGRAVRKWHHTDPKVEELIGNYRMTPVMDHLSDSIAAMLAVAAKHDATGNRDRKLHFELAGILKTRQALEVMGEGGGPVQVQNLDEEYQRDMDALLKRMNETPTANEPDEEDEDSEEE